MFPTPFGENLPPGLDGVVESQALDTATIQEIADRLTITVREDVSRDKTAVARLKTKLVKGVSTDMRLARADNLTPAAQRMRQAAEISLADDDAEIMRIAPRLNSYLPAEAMPIGGTGFPSPSAPGVSPATQAQSPARPIRPPPPDSSCDPAVLAHCLPGGLPDGWRWVRGLPCYATHSDGTGPGQFPPTDSPCWVIRHSISPIEGDTWAWKLEWSSGGGPGGGGGGGGPPVPPVPPICPPVPICPPPRPCEPCPVGIPPGGEEYVAPYCPVGVPAHAQIVAHYHVPFLSPGSRGPSVYSECGRKQLDDSFDSEYPVQRLIAAFAPGADYDSVLSDVGTTPQHIGDLLSGN